MKKIIIPVDFSEYTEYALRTAASIAKKYDLQIELITMIKNPNSYSNESMTLTKEFFFSIKFAEKRMENLIESDYLQGVNVSYIIKHYKMFSELGEFAKQQNGDLIIMGTHGSNNLKDFFLGSNTEKAVRTSETPILVVKETIENIDERKVLFVSNYREKAIPAYKKAMTIFSKLNMVPTLLFVNKYGEKFLNPDQLLERITTFLEMSDGNTDKLKLFKSIESTGVGVGAHQFAKENGIEMITIPTNGRSSVGKFFKKSDTLEMSGKSAYPIMSIKM